MPLSLDSLLDRRELKASSPALPPLPLPEQTSLQRLQILMDGENQMLSFERELLENLLLKESKDGPFEH